ncbi:putative pectate lyase 2, partial [Glycine soja]
ATSPTLLLISCFILHLAYSTESAILNRIDSCWRAKSNWASNRQAMANCAIGFGKDAVGGYPKTGTLHYGVIQKQTLWIIFAKDMVIRLKNELIMNSYKTIDGRGAKVEIANRPCITIQGVSHVIIHGIKIHDCKPSKVGLVRSTQSHLCCDGDGIGIFASSNVWIDHCFLARCADGLIDVIHASTSITISNNYFTQHDRLAIPSSLSFVYAVSFSSFNRFASGLIERMPRVRLGYAHVVNNKYDGWKMYAIGGSSNPTTLSEGNYYVAPNNPATKQVRKGISSE